MKLVIHARLKIVCRKTCGFDSHLRHHFNMRNSNTAYVIGAALGDGNLSNPNGRATRLRISCDAKYPDLITRIGRSLEIMLPDNSINSVDRGNCIDVYCYSNKLEVILGWKADSGSKYVQRTRVPQWIFQRDTYIRACLKGLIETDGSIFIDRTYTHINFTTIIPELAEDVENMLQVLGYIYSIQRIQEKRENVKPKYVIRICKRSHEFIRELKIDKS